MTIQTYQVTEQAGDTHVLPFEFNFHYDLTGATIETDLKAGPTDQSKVAQQYSVESFLVDPDGDGTLTKGRVTLTLTPQQTADLLPYDSGSSQQNSKHYTSVRVTLPNGYTQSLFRVELTVEAVSTRAGTT